MPRYQPENDLIHYFCERLLALDPSIPIRTVDELRYEPGTLEGNRVVLVQRCRRAAGPSESA